MTTLGTMKTRIATEMGRDDLTSRIGDAITSAIAHYETKRFWFNEATTTTTTTASDDDYSPPSDLLSLDQLHITQAGIRRELTPVDFQTLDTWRGATTTTGVPSWFSEYGGLVYLYPEPDATYTLTWNYIKSLAALSSDSSTNEWMTYAEALIRNRAKFDLFTTLRNPVEAQVAKGLETEALRALQRRSVSRVTTGRIKATEF